MTPKKIFVVLMLMAYFNVAYRIVAQYPEVNTDLAPLHKPAMPDYRMTPGEVRTTDSKQVCSTSTKEFRKTTEAMKRQVCLQYHSKDCPHQGIMELDHLIPLELGGADTVDNIWPQPAKPVPGFHEKDKLENYLHKQVCAGKMNLIDAQSMIRTDWAAAYNQYVKPSN